MRCTLLGGGGSVRGLAALLALGRVELARLARGRRLLAVRLSLLLIGLRGLAVALSLLVERLALLVEPLRLLAVGLRLLVEHLGLLAVLPLALLLAVGVTVLRRAALARSRLPRGGAVRLARRGAVRRGGTGTLLPFLVSRPLRGLVGRAHLVSF